jgi:hypothetical protein
MELPDFTANPLWNTLSSDATLMFFPPIAAFSPLQSSQ